MNDWKWINKQLLIILHDESLVLHGGTPGIRDENLLDSALHRPLNLATYREPDFAELAASYAVGLAKNHAFVDGNKRAAFLSVGLFLGINKYKLLAAQVDATLMMEGIAGGEIMEVEFSNWIRLNSLKL
jgi:death-on-curing protein